MSDEENEFLTEEGEEFSESGEIEEEEEPFAPGSTVRLADEEERQSEPEIIPQYKVTLPAPSSMNARVAEQIASEHAKRFTGKNMGTSVAKGKQAMETIENSKPDEVTIRKIELCRIMNEKRTTYKGRIQYQFKANYDPNRFSLQQLETEHYSSDVIINSQDVPTLLKDAGMKCVEVLEILGKIVGLPVEGLSGDVRIAMKEGVFDGECEQLSIEWGSYFARPPLQRVILKMGMLMTKTVERNMKPAFMPPPVKTVRTQVEEQEQEQHSKEEPVTFDL